MYLCHRLFFSVRTSQTATTQAIQNPRMLHKTYICPLHFLFLLLLPFLSLASFDPVLGIDGARDDIFREGVKSCEDFNFYTFSLVIKG